MFKPALTGPKGSHAVLPLLILLLIAPAQARRCVLDDAEVNPDNGATTAGKTGVLRCYRDDGALWYEKQLQDGEHLGLERFHDQDGSVREREVNAQGNTQGRSRQWYPGGQLKQEGEFRNARAVGTHRSFHRDGKPAAVSVYPTAGEPAAFRVEWDERGGLRQLHCAASSVIDLDKPLCGHGRPVTVALVDQRGRPVETRQMQSGSVKRIERIDPDSGRRSLTEFSAEGRTERQFHPDGRLAQERVVEDGFVVRDATWFMNGAPQSVTTREARQRDAREVVERYRDSGVLAERETRIGRRLLQRELFDDVGRPSETWDHDAEGVAVRHRRYRADGVLLVDDALYPDGSRKASLLQPESR